MLRNERIRFVLDTPSQWWNDLERDTPRTVHSRALRLKVLVRDPEARPCFSTCCTPDGERSNSQSRLPVAYRNALAIFATGAGTTHCEIIAYEFNVL